MPVDDDEGKGAAAARQGLDAAEGTIPPHMLLVASRPDSRVRLLGWPPNRGFGVAGKREFSDMGFCISVTFHLKSAGRNWPQKLLLIVTCC
jgi:hypothetical protein